MTTHPDHGGELMKHEGMSPSGDTAHVGGGFFVCLVVPRHERVYIRQVTLI